MFGGDPFGDPFGGIFGGMHQQMRRQMREMDRMMNSMMDPFGMFNRHSMFPGMIEDAPRHHREPVRDDMALMDPFGFGGGLFGGIMRHMEDIQSAALNDPNSHVYTQSTMITFDGQRQPRIEESSIRKSGDVKETRHSVRHGDGGVGDRMSIEHTIGDRTHVIEKKRDRDGRIREQQKFVNLDEKEAEDFDREFASRARRNMGGGVDVRRAIEHGSPRSRAGNTSATRDRSSHGKGSSNTPIVTLPDDEYDDDHSPVRFRSGSRREDAHSNHGGPIIREIDDEEQEKNGAKRRKGVLGRLFKANDE